MPLFPIVSQQTGLIASRFPSIPNDKYLDAPTTVFAGNQTIAGLSVRGFFGPGELLLLGSFSAATLTTGSQAGTAGTGTTTTSLVKPTGAANWTASELLGKFIRVIAGGGVSSTSIPTVREIRANTTTAISVDTVAGMDSTTVFEIVDPSAIVTSDPTYLVAGLEVVGNSANITFVGFDFSTSGLNYSVYSRRNRGKIDFVGCRFTKSGVVNTIDSDDDWSFALSNCALSGGAQAAISNCHKAVAKAYLNAASGVTIDRCHTVETSVVALDATGNALTVKRANNLTLGLKADSCDATPLVIETVERTDVTTLTGASNTGYGCDISKGGVHNVNGATITGTLGDFILDGIAHASVTWSASSSLGAVSRWGTTLLISGSSNTRQELDTVRFEGNVDITAAGLVSGSGGQLQQGGRSIFYGYLHLPQNDSLTAYAGGGQANATALGLGANVVTTVGTAGDSVKLPAGAVIGGAIIHVKNLGANSLNVFPSTGGAINALADNTAIAIAAGSALFFVSRNNGSGGLDWVTQ